MLVGKSINTIVQDYVLPMLTYPDGDIPIPLVWDNFDYETDPNPAPPEMESILRKFNEPEGFVMVRLIK